MYNIIVIFLLFQNLKHFLKTAWSKDLGCFNSTNIPKFENIKRKPLIDAILEH